MFQERLFAVLVLVTGVLVTNVLGNCTIHPELQGYYNISDLGQAVLLNLTNQEIDYFLDIGCDVNFNTTCADYMYNRDHETWLDGYGELTEIIFFIYHLHNKKNMILFYQGDR